MASQSYQLVMRTGPAPGKVFALDKAEIYFGRDISNDIVINDAEVSRKHVRLILQGSQYILEDLGSTNGTFIDNQRVTGPQLLNAGQVIQMGENVTMILEALRSDPEATMAMGKPDQTARETRQAQQAMPAPPAYQPPPAPPPPQSYPAPQAYPQQPYTPPPAYAPPPPPAYAAPPARQTPSSTYTGQAEEYPAEAPKKKRRTPLLIGCGCLLALSLCLAAVFYAIDYFAAWCRVMPFLSGC